MSDFSRSKMSDDNWKTPEGVYRALDSEFHFDDDPCPLVGAKLLKDGLSRPWGKSVFMNPPYSNPTPWVKRAFEESTRGSTVVGLLRCDTSAAWFHDWVWNKAELRFVRGRLTFFKGSVGHSAPFASVIAVWRPHPARKCAKESEHGNEVPAVRNQYDADRDCRRELAILQVQ